MFFVNSHLSFDLGNAFIAHRLSPGKFDLGKVLSELLESDRSVRNAFVALTWVRPDRTGVSGCKVEKAYLSISVPAKTKDTTSVCDGSLQECLNARHLGSEFPTIAASHLARMLVESNTFNTGERGAFCPIRNNRYIDCFPVYSKPPKERCGEAYKRSC
ncbi:hypothetical protein LR48_Vigan03g016300 [Vigna angularis]|uniref:Uncharacterized protein n=1 Tax=Phaseolus angularis TaxID=3914 RepID=A0A0L9U277_PHAAN|nr:hypothetical protein LR48_Vigan03g016300 [Vigna angularis]